MTRTPSSCRPRAPGLRVCPLPRRTSHLLPSGSLWTRFPGAGAEAMGRPAGTTAPGSDLRRGSPGRILAQLHRRRERSRPEVAPRGAFFPGRGGKSRGAAGGLLPHAGCVQGPRCSHDAGGSNMPGPAPPAVWGAQAHGEHPPRGERTRPRARCPREEAGASPEGPARGRCDLIHVPQQVQADIY